MKTAIIVSILIVICFSANVFSQPTVEICFKNPVTIVLNSADLKSDPNFEGRLKFISTNLKEGEKLFIYTYSKGRFGTTGLGSITSAIKAKAEYLFKSKDLYEIKEGGYRTEASVDLFVLNSECQIYPSKEYEGESGMSLFQVDFLDAPLGLSVFSTAEEMDGLISKENECGKYRYDCGWVFFAVIVGLDGRVIHADAGVYETPNTTFWSVDDKALEKIYATARQSLVNWAFKTPVIDGVPRYIRGGVAVRVPN